MGAAAFSAAAEDLSDQYAFSPIRIGGGGFVTGLAAHPDADGPLYARTDVGGVYRREGEKWVQLFTAAAIPPGVLSLEDGELAPGASRPHTYHVEAIAIDPADPDVLLVAAGRFRSLPGVMLRSEDGGATFERSSIDAVMIGNAKARFHNERLAVQPGGTGVVLFGSRLDGLFRSEDGGRTFAPVEGIPAGSGGSDVVGVGPVVFDPDRPAVAYLSAEGSGTHRSEDGGATWTRIGDPVATDLEISGGVLFLATEDGAAHRFAEGRWSDVTPDGGKVIDLAVHPGDPEKLYALSPGGQRFWRSDDGGEGWTRLRANSIDADGRAMYRSPEIPWVENSSVREWMSVGDLRFDPRDPDHLWFAEGMGVWRSTPLSEADPAEGPAFENVSQGIEETVATDIHAAPGGRVTALIWDRIGFFFPDFESLGRYPRTQVGLADEFSMGIRVNAQGGNPDFLVASVADTRLPSGVTSPYGYDGDGNHSGFSTDGGATWTPFGSLDPETEFNEPRTLKFGEIAVNAADADNLVWLPRVYLDEDGVDYDDQHLHYSTDRGATWRPAELGGYFDKRNNYLSAKRSLAADPVLPGRFYAWHFKSGTLHRSDDGGRTWAEPEGAASAAPYAYHNQLEPTPGVAEDLWLASGYDLRAPDAVTGLFHTRDGGLTWEKIPGVEQAWAVGHGRARETGGPPTLFVYGLIDGRWGLYRSEDDGGRFDLLSEAPLGLFDQVTCIAGDPDVFGRVYVGFQGNGFAYGQPR